MQAAFVYTVQLAIGCVHTPFNFFLIMPHINVNVFLMYVYKFKAKFKVLPHHQKFSSYAPESKETGVVAYTCRYSSGQLIPIFQSIAVAELRIKGPLEYLQV